MMSTDNNMSESRLKPVIDRMVEENEKQRQEIKELRRQKEEMGRSLRKAEGELKAIQLKYGIIESQKNKQTAETRRFMECLEQEKKERIKLLTENSEMKNKMSRNEVELEKNKAGFENLSSQNARLKRQLQGLNVSQVSALKERQSTLNTAKMMQTRLEASETDKKFLSIRATQLQAQLNNVKAELSEISKKYHDKQIGVQAIYRDDTETKQKLLMEFQRKVSDKDEQTVMALQNYIDENSMLKRELIELKSLMGKKV